ncbi:MAG TPA: hypothetical protein VJH88_06400 [Candidatus Nanoarchaeia archaeon]|nr:hypothetical protein [Candidatus Nanoarchaeia archaeon]
MKITDVCSLYPKTAVFGILILSLDAVARRIVQQKHPEKTSEFRYVMD